MDKHFILWNIWKSDRKRKRKKALCPLGQNSLRAAGPAREAAQRAGARARARFKPDGRGPSVSEREGGDGGERLTGRARLSSLTPSPERRLGAEVVEVLREQRRPQLAEGEAVRGMVRGSPLRR